MELNHLTKGKCSSVEVCLPDTPPTPTSPSLNAGCKCRLESLLRDASIRRDDTGVRHRLPAQELRLLGLLLEGSHSGCDDVDWASLRCRVVGGGGCL